MSCDCKGTTHATETRRTEEKSTRATNTNTIYANVDYIELRWKRSTGKNEASQDCMCSSEYLMEYWWIAVCKLLKCYWLKAVLVSLVTFFRVKTLWNLIEMIWLVLLSVECAWGTHHFGQYAWDDTILKCAQQHCKVAPFFRSLSFHFHILFNKR